MSNLQPEEMGEEEHRAWLDSLSDEERMIVDVPRGYMHHMLAIALGKRILADDDLRLGDRLYVLEMINALTDSYISPEMLAAIQPMSDTELTIFREAKSLDADGEKLGQASFKVLTSWKVFNYFLALNPSLLVAIKMRKAVSSNNVVTVH